MWRAATKEEPRLKAFFDVFACKNQSKYQNTAFLLVAIQILD
jgi:hypothetical protein